MPLGEIAAFGFLGDGTLDNPDPSKEKQSASYRWRGDWEIWLGECCCDFRREKGSFVAMFHIHETRWWWDSF